MEALTPVMMVDMVNTVVMPAVKHTDSHILLCLGLEAKIKC